MTGGALRLPRWLAPAVVVAIALLAFLVRFQLLDRGGLVSSDAYDDGVYYAAADALVHGRLPYRDFLLLQPPGVLIALAPFAWLGSLTSDVIGMVTARLAFMAIGALNTVLVTVLAGRFGRVAAVIAGIGYAVFAPAVYSERSTLLEPLGTLGVLLALLLLRRRPYVAGLAVGLAVTMKIWYVVPLVVLIGFAARRVRLLAGAATGLVVVLLPFLLAGPGAMIREVVLDQLGRSRIAGWGINRRLGAILGAPALHLSGLPWLTQGRIALVLLGCVLVFGAIACTVRGALVYPVLTGVCGIVLLASPSFYAHYVVLAAPWGAVTVGIGAARVLTLLRDLRLRGLAVAVLLLAVVGVNLHGDTRRVSRWIPHTVLAPAAAAVPGCVTADDPVLLAALNVLSRDFERGCAVWPDVTGYTLDEDAVVVNGVDVPRKQNARWQRHVLAYLSSGDAVIRDRPGTGLSLASRTRLNHTPVLARSGPFVLHDTRVLHPAR